MGLLKVIAVVHASLRYCSTTGKSTVMKYLNVAEKNDAAKNIASLLSRGGSTRREGLSNYNKIYEFDGTVFGHPAGMVMTSVSGHLLNYEFASTFRNWKSCNPVVLFDVPVVKSCSQDYQNIKRTLEKEIRSCHGLIIWTDCDREGENIGFEIVKVCTDIKPNIPVYRAKFSEITAASIFRALNNLERPDKNVSDAVDVRQELDLRTGAAFTRLQTLRLQKVFPQSLADKLISYGSCQFPTLGFVVERYQAIENFIAEPFWRIKMNHKLKDLTVDYNWQRERLYDKNACEAILDICQENPLATVEQVESKSKSKWRPLPLDTVELEKNASRKLQINAKSTMKIAEKLYTQGYISYPRTETNIFPKELNLVPLVEQQFDDSRWGSFARRIMEEGGPNPRQGRKSDQAHPPIHPTKYVNNLTGNEKKIYEYIVRHFLACLSKDALGQETVVHVDIADEKFTAKGLVILEKNYLDVYTYDKWNAKEIHEYQTGDTFTPSELSLFEGRTTAPKLLTEADLITLMEKHGIGTDATHAEHIETIKSREYVGLQQNIYFVPGTLGMGLVEGYNNIGLEVSLAKPNLRADFEKDLKLICEGRKSAEQVKREQIEKYKAVFCTVMEKMIEIDRTLANRLQDEPRQFRDEVPDEGTFKPVLKCPKCGNDMIIRNRKNGLGKFLSCVAYPSCKNAVWFPTFIDTIEILDESCSSCGPNVKRLKVKFKQNPFLGEPNPNILCIGGCDTIVLDTLDINCSSVCANNRYVNERRNADILVIPNEQTLNNWINSANDVSSTQPTYSSTNRNNGSRNHSNIRTYSSQGNQHDEVSSSTSGTSNNNFRTSRSILSSNGTVNRNGGNLLSIPRNGHVSNNGNRNSGRPNHQGDGDTVLCKCNVEAIMLTVRKEGPNTGRKFYKCQANGGQETCNFFMWAPDDSSTVNPSANNSLPGPSRSLFNCDCNLPAVERTVSKEGPNTGRRFYCCPKPLGEGCRFFKWADEVDGNNRNNGDGGSSDDDDNNDSMPPPSLNTSRNSRWVGNNGNRWKKNNKWKSKYKRKSKGSTSPFKAKSKMPKTREKKKCGICRQPGHTRNNCPNN